jgi:hypothetical protein
MKRPPWTLDSRVARRFCVLLALLPALHSTAQKTEELAVSALRLAACDRMTLLYELGADSGTQRGPPRPGMARQSLADARVATSASPLSPLDTPRCRHMRFPP